MHYLSLYVMENIVKDSFVFVVEMATIIIDDFLNCVIFVNGFQLTLIVLLSFSLSLTIYH